MLIVSICSRCMRRIAARTSALLAGCAGAWSRPCVASIAWRAVWREIVSVIATATCRVALVTRHALPALLGKPDDEALGAADVGQPIRVLVLHHFADQFGAVGAQARDDVVETLDGEHE